MKDIGRVEEASVYLVSRYDFSWEDIKKILEKKGDTHPMVIYAPYNKDKGRMPTEEMAHLDERRNVAVTNFRGRLLNDLFTAMVTTKFQK